MATHVRVEYDLNRYVTRHASRNDEWDRDDTAADIEIHGIEIALDKGYRDITVPFEVDINKSYFLLWADYNTGDSFGHDDNVVEFIDLFETRERAQEARVSLLNVNGFSGVYTREDGTPIKYHIPWAGYFENLNELVISVVRVTRLD